MLLLHCSNGKKRSRCWKRSQITTATLVSRNKEVWRLEISSRLVGDNNCRGYKLYDKLKDIQSKGVGKEITIALQM